MNQTEERVPTASEPHLLGPVAKRAVARALLKERKKSLIEDLGRLEILDVPGVRMYVDAAAAAIDDGIAEVSK